MISADLSGIDAFVAGSEGIIEAIESPGFKGDFVDSLTKTIKKNFMIDVVTAKESGLSSLNHMFEWGDSQGETTSQPLFALTKKNSGASAATIGFKFLPSTKPVPLPDPGRYGFNPKKLDFLSRHTFEMKALVMETQSSVVISTDKRSGLFIPTTRNKRGYVMSKRPTRINPGGSQATGGFSNFWNNWFDSRAREITINITRRYEEELGATGRKVMRYAAGTVINGEKVGGRFVSGNKVTVTYVNPRAASIKAYAKAQVRARTSEGDFEE